MGFLFLNKILLILFLMSVFNVSLHAFEIIKRLRQDNPETYQISRFRRVILGLSISYIITSIITGITI